MAYGNIREEELKNKVATDYFNVFDCTKIIGNIDFCVTTKLKDRKQTQIFETESLLWAESKKGKSEILKSIVQLILTIGKARTFDKSLPPAYLGAFDSEKIAFIPYNDIHEIFYINDFNWTVTSSNHETKEFKLVYDKVKTIIENNSLLFHFDKDEKEIKEFIKNNFVVGKSITSKIKIDKNNFMVIYNKWLSVVKPTIAVNWDVVKKSNIIDGDFYLADILSIENESIKDKLFVLLKKDHYELGRVINESGLFSSSTTGFSDLQKAHKQFWNKYERPPKEEYWDYIVGRRDLLVPQDVRERKGSFFTPQTWVGLSQKYLTDVLGKDWQEEYYIWDCASGTGNLLIGLVNKYNIWASTLDKQDVDVMYDRIEYMNKNSPNGDGSNLLKEHVFQFDFLNDEFTKLPKGLQEIINNPEKRKKLVIYINPPYAEHGNKTTISAHGEHKTSVATTSKVYNDFNKMVGTSTRELFVQFFLRVYKDIPGAKLASFSTLKFINSPNFELFRNYFKSSFEKGFVCKADTFDNVKGKFPIGFLIWTLNTNKNINSISVDVADDDESIISNKNFFIIEKNKYFINWFRPYIDRKENELGSLHIHSNDMQQQNVISITSVPTKSDLIQKTFTYITKYNLVESCMYYAIRHCIEATWLNNRDQFLLPNDRWKIDLEFQNDCLTYTLFNTNIQSKFGVNNWIPYTEKEVNSQEKFESNFMTNFINGKIKQKLNVDLFEDRCSIPKSPLKFSDEAKEVFDTGRELWKYYHKQTKCNVNASLYDIREHFQGRNESGKMNNKSEDETYMKLISELRDSLKVLSKKIELKVYDYEFLKA
jgi:hypothetical protein